MGPIQSVSELARYYGDPPDAALGRFRIPLLGVDAPLGTRQVGADGSIPASTGPADVVWYDFSGWDALGGEIGGGRNAVFSGHVDYGGFVSYAGVQFRGAAVFRDLEQLLPGDLIHVDIDGRTLTYVVQWLRQVSASSGDWGAMLSGDVETDSITLITCGGDFDDTSRSYSDRVVVRATRR